jgi:hypothetical protein
LQDEVQRHCFQIDRFFPARMDHPIDSRSERHSFARAVLNLVSIGCTGNSIFDVAPLARVRYGTQAYS